MHTQTSPECALEAGFQRPPPRNRADRPEDAPVARAGPRKRRAVVVRSLEYSRYPRQATAARKAGSRP